MPATSPLTDTLPTSPKKYFLPFYGALAALGPFGLDMYLPAIPEMADAFGAGIVAMNNTVSAFLIGYAIGQFLGGPISDQIGRKPVGLIGISVYVLCCLGIVFVTSVEEILVLRFLQAIGGGFATVICLASLRDIYWPKEAGRKFAVVMMIMLIAPVIAPSMGAFMVDFGWQTIFGFLIAYGAFMAAWFYFLIPESRKGPKDKLSLVAIFPQYLEVITFKHLGKPIAIMYAFATSFSAGVMMVFLTNSSFVYMEYFGVSEKVFSLFFGASVLFMMGATLFTMRNMMRLGAQRIFRTGALIQLAMTTLLLLAVWLPAEPHLYVVALLIALSVGTVGLINPSSTAVYISYFDKRSGSASSLTSSLLLTMGGILGAISGLMFDGSLVPVVAMMLVSTVLCNVLARMIPKES